jgi:hypothetical protein
VRTDDILILGSTVDERIDLLDSTVVDRNSESLGFHVHDEVLAHDGETDKTNICLLHRFSFLVFNQLSTETSLIVPYLPENGIHFTQ